MFAGEAANPVEAARGRDRAARRAAPSSRPEPVDGDRHATEPGAPADRPLDLVGRLHVDFEPLAADGHRRLTVRRGAQRQLAAAVADRDVGEVLAGADRQPPAVLAEAPFEQLEASLEAGFVGRAPITTEIRSTPLRLPEPTST